MNSFTTIPKFRFWCQKILPLVYDDSLSYMELLCKVIDYLNKVIEDINNIPDYINEVVSEDVLKDILSELLDELREQIARANEGKNTTASFNRDVDELVWLDGKLVRMTRAILAGDRYVEDDGTPDVTGNFVYTSVEMELQRVKVNLTNEINARIQADTQLQGNIDAEELARQQADTQLQSNIDAEELARQQADTQLQGDIDAEELARQQADTQLQTAINNLSKFPWINVDDYGAVGDGVTDDSEAINACITQFGGNHVYIFAPNKTYKIDSNILVKYSGITLIGYNSKILSSNNAQETHAPYMISCRDRNGSGDSLDVNIRLTDINIIGLEISGGGVGITARNCDNINIQDCYIHNGYTDSIDIEFCTNVTIDNNNIEPLDYYGINIYQTREFVISNNHVKGQITCITVKGSYNQGAELRGVITNNILLISRESGTAISSGVVPEEGWLQGLIIDSNQIIGFSGDHIGIRTGNYTRYYKITNNYFRGCGVLATGYRNKLSNNTFIGYSNNERPCVQYVTNDDTPSQYGMNICENNYFAAESSTQCYISVGSYFNEIHDNILMGGKNTAGDIQILTTYNRVHDNYFSDTNITPSVIEAAAAVGNNEVFNNRTQNNAPKPYVKLASSSQFYNNQTGAIKHINTTPPASGEHDVGEMVYNSNPTIQGTSPNQYVVYGWLCTTSGTPGTWSKLKIPV